MIKTWIGTQLACLLLLGAGLPLRAGDLRSIEGVVYGSDDPAYQVLSGHLLPGPGSAPALILLDSGGWRSGKAGHKATTSSISQAFNEAGFSTLYVSHRSIEKYRWPAQIDDVARAIQYIKSRAGEWNIDPARISVMGRSSGGHLALLAGLLPDRADLSSSDPVLRQSSRPLAVVAGSAPADLAFMSRQLARRNVGERDIDQILTNLIGLPPGSPEFYRKLERISPINHIDWGSVPVFLYYVGPENVTDPNDPSLLWHVHTPVSGVLLSQRLKAFEVRHQLFQIPDLDARRDELTQRQIAFLKGLPGQGAGNRIELKEWERGIAFVPPADPSLAMYLWFYEWTLFDSVRKGEHTLGSYKHPRRVSPETGQIDAPEFRLEARAVEDGAELLIHVTNRSDYDWPELAAIIPCFNPGPEESRNAAFSDLERSHTYFRGKSGLEAIPDRSIHFNHLLRPALEKLSPGMKFVFSEKWPTSDRDAAAGLIIRESSEGGWVAAIAWEDYLSVQGHNPWKCMHHSVRVGPLKSGETRTIRGRVFLFQGNREECWKRYAGWLARIGSRAGRNAR